MENPPADDQEVREKMVDYLLMNKELFEDGQQASSLYGDPDFKEAVFSAYGDVYTYTTCIVPICAIQKESRQTASGVMASPSVLPGTFGRPTYWCTAYVHRRATAVMPTKAHAKISF